MKILAIGDFHGKFPQKLKKQIEKEGFDVILSPGDYCGNEKLAELFFKYAYGKKDSEVPEKIQKEMEKLDKISLRDGINLIKELKKIKKPIYGIRGNWDPTPWERDIGLPKSDSKEKKQAKKLIDLESKNFKFIDFKSKNFNNFVVIASTSSTCPGKLGSSRHRKRIQDLSGKEEKKYIGLIKKQYKKRKEKLETLFKKAKKQGKEIVFLTHNSPYRTKLDKIKKGPQKGKHYGNFLEKELIKRYKPRLVVCGHIHEGFCKQQIGRTLVVNSGAAYEGRAAIIDYNKNQGKVEKVKFLK